MLTLFYGLHCTLQLLHFKFIFVLSAYLHVFNTWHYHISLNNIWGSYFKISLGKRAKLRRNTTQKNIAVLNDFGIYKFYQYIKTDSNIEFKKKKKMSVKILHFYVIIVIASLHFFLIFLKYK